MTQARRSKPAPATAGRTSPRRCLAIGGRLPHLIVLGGCSVPSYYAAFVSDPDRNNIEAVCHRPE